MALVEVGFQPEPWRVQGDPFGEAQDGFDVELFRSLVVLVNLGQSHGFVQLVELLFVGGLVDGLLVDEGIDELFFAPLQVRDLPLCGDPPGCHVFPSGLPDVQDDGPEESQELGMRPEALEEAQELGLQFVPRDVGLAAAGVRRAVVVGVALALALGPGAGERVPTDAAGREAPEREVRVVALSRYDLAVGAHEALAAPEGVFVYQRRPVADGLDVPGALEDPADIDPVGEHLAPFLSV